MTATLVMQGSLAAAMPGVIALQASFVLNLERELAASLKLLAQLELDLPELQLALDLALGLSAALKASLSFDPKLTIAASLSYAADAQLALAAGLSGPSLSLGLSVQLDAQLKVAADVSAKLAIKATLLADVTLRIGLLKAALKFAIGFGGKMSASAGIRLYVYNGALEDFTTELEALLATPEGSAGLDGSLPAYCAVLVTDSAVSFNGLGLVMDLGG